MDAATCCRPQEDECVTRERRTRCSDIPRRYRVAARVQALIRHQEFFGPTLLSMPYAARFRRIEIVVRYYKPEAGDARRDTVPHDLIDRTELDPVDGPRRCMAP